ncbi:NUDIX hydrolase [Kineosporia sp. J2-2]|uniref:NUDIX hydrolase n=1 Tax=Kineosporia corallincola TaxID=2835133 RepID=A0ABS5TN62_9ACTN|nr:NUDIX hydrolase [Kineosporia corallincola]MBT0772545.1 NUDIX hydrolase [Kineosporia corallincola]
MTAPDFEDFLAPRPVLAHDLIHHGKIWDIVSEKVDLGEAGQVTRELMDHPGAVTVLALDDQERVLMIRQYRHPVQMELWELPAGLLDVPGENPVAAAQRELLEEADLRAAEWSLLAEWFNSPGGSNEALRCYLARGVSEVPEAERYQRGEEELNMPTRWVPLDEARDAVLAGAIHNPGAVIGILAAVAAKAAGWSTLRPADAPWPAHRNYR